MAATAPYAATRTLTRDEPYDLAARWLNDSYDVPRDDLEAMAAWVASLDRGDVDSRAAAEQHAVATAIRLDSAELQIATLTAQLQIAQGVARSALARLTDAAFVRATVTSARVETERDRRPAVARFDFTDADPTVVVEMPAIERTPTRKIQTLSMSDEIRGAP